MKSLLVFFCALSAILFFSYGSGGAHSGGLDSKGGHYNRKTGEYHYHRGGDAESRKTSKSIEVKQTPSTKNPTAGESKRKKREK